MQIGILVAKQGDIEEAMKYFNRVIELDPKNAAALNNKGNLLVMGDHYLEAQEVYRKAADASPDDPYVLISLTKAYRSSNNLKEAKKSFDRALKIDPNIKKKYKTLALELQNTL
jgi:tetratricopeptide (TPR) repeat protein